MFTYIKLKNFMSFSEIEFDLRKGSQDYKKFVAIYGENGSGKTNFTKSLEFLLSSMQSLRILEIVENYRDQYVAENTVNYGKMYERELERYNISRIMEKTRMISCVEPTRVEYGFIVKGHKGYYVVEYSDRILHEEMYYYTGKQRGKLFQLSYANEKIEKNISPKLFQTKSMKNEIVNEIDKYWGKHTLLSIINYQIMIKNADYVLEGILPHILYVMATFENSYVACSTTNGMTSDALTYTPSPKNILLYLEQGKINVYEMSKLKKTERIINDFFTQSYSDIKKVYFEIRPSGESEIEYELYVKKMIGGEVRTINFRQESAGTRRVLNVLQTVLGVIDGKTVFYDEIDNGIHDLLLKNIIESIEDEITGQLIITTHNTLLLESINIKSVYVICVDYMGNKSAVCLSEYPRIQGTNNPRNMYIKGMFGGVPFSQGIDFADITEILSEVEE